jgi:hypothetical protein
MERRLEASFYAIVAAEVERVGRDQPPYFPLM